MRVVGIDLGGTNMRAVAADAAGRIVAELRERTDPRGGGAVLEQLVRLARGVAGEPIAALALGTAGVVDPASQELALVNNIAGLRDLHPREWLHRELAVPVLVENDLNLAALGEQWRGRARGIANFAFIGVGTGLGMGLVVDRRLVRGARGAAGELGFLPLARPSGAFEHEVCGAGVVAAAAAHASWIEPPPRLAEDVFALAESGYVPAVEIVATIGRRLASAIAAVSVVVDPELVILGGGVGASETLLEPVRAATAELLPFAPRIERTALGDRAALHGAVALALQATTAS